jgi:4-amino-4-deoxy-L-arabinose transferase-like glycosyltransferase
MPLRRPGILSRMPPALCRFVAAFLILGAAALHFTYLARACPLDLASDEAHYWDWSRHLDWSYYSKGPLVAWLIRASCEVAGGWSEQLTGNLTLAVRLPAVICGSLLLVSLYVLSVQVYGKDQTGLAVVGIALTLPIIAVGASVMTIDAPYTCCWGWALVLAYRAIFRGSAWAWPAAGLVVGLGILAKYTMALFIPCVGLFLLATPAYRGLLRRPGFWIMTAVAAAGCLPILVWNYQHQWITFQHLRALAGFGKPVPDEAPDGPGFYWSGPLVYLGGQAALLLGLWFVVWLSAMVVHRPTVEKDPRLNYLWWLSALMFAWFWAFSFKTGGGEVNWPVTSYLSGLVLSAAWLGRQLESSRAWYRRWTRVNVAIGCALGLAITFALHHSEWLHPVLARIAGPAGQTNRFPLRKLDPTCRLRGWRTTLATAVDAELDRLRAEGTDHVFLAGQSWTMPGELGVYCKGHPDAYTLGPVFGDRHSQYDLWPGPLTKSDEFLGRTFLFVGDPSDELKAGFSDVGRPREVVHYEQGRPISYWVLTVCRGYKGFPIREGKKF